MSAERADPPVPDHPGVPGKTLAAHREALGWTVEQVADQLKLAVRQVIALEEGDYANLPGPAVVRGFVRAYAKILKLDAAPLVAQIALETAPPDTSPVTVRRDKPASFSQVRFPSHGKRPSKAPLILGTLLVLALGGAAAAWQLGLLPAGLLASVTPGAAPATPAVTLPATAPDAAVTVLPPPLAPGAGAPDAAKPAEALPPVISNPVPLISVPPASTPSPSAAGGATPAGVAPAAPAGMAPAAVAPTAPAAAAAPNTLVLTVRADSWIEVRQPKGPKLFSGLVKGGRIETVTVNGPVTLVVGNPSAVDATLRGQSVPLSAVPGGRVARINLE